MKPRVWSNNVKIICETIVKFSMNSQICLKMRYIERIGISAPSTGESQSFNLSNHPRHHQSLDLLLNRFTTHFLAPHSEDEWIRRNNNLYDSSIFLKIYVLLPLKSIDHQSKMRIRMFPSKRSDYSLPHQRVE